MAVTVDIRWYRPKKFSHFDLPLSEGEAVRLATTPSRVIRHAFFPFISFNMTRRRYKKKKEKVEISSKTRTIRLSSHRDGYIFAYYSRILADWYEASIIGTPLDACVLAYRSGRGSNILFAKEAFLEVQRRGRCVAITMDIKEFFESIDHAVLKECWQDLLGERLLPPDHFAVYRAITAYSWVERDVAFRALGVDERKKIPHPLCSADVFRNEVRGNGLISKNMNQHGVPQGASISATMSNIYMIPFDQSMQSLAYAIDGYYKRYCDDILWIADPDDEDLIVSRVNAELAKLGKALKVSNEKSTISHFDQNGKLLDDAKPLQYLGFVYDGNKRLIRSQTLSKFWRKVIFGVRAAKRRAGKADRIDGDGRLYKRKLYRRFTHLGKKNFLCYARRAGEIMDDKNIWSQVKNHWDRVQEEIKKPL